ncbi:3-oxoacyl-[acyl-carrier-protein] synthase-3 [Paenibacillus castaneae]|uniref:3-oxoacyl-ACP synthase III family protein n=1 Tax=Paenibacillus castaneae TaxID=474957 RepID=UPI000C9CC927|nr:ketoacyl-ACP synthase III [Paenibacillus castaneae]NIK76089.1 3-oxoacyl-[acyl-carrier-protein] synthase-3 [Paenibacillus castaneae]
MARLVLENISIRGIVCALPKNKININDLNDSFSTKEINKISRMTGVKSFYRVSEDQTTSDLCILAAERLLTSLEWDKSNIDGVIFVSQTPDYVLPATACVIQAKLGLSEECIAFDINLGCSGYVYGMMVAAQLIQTGNLKRVLLLVGDTISKIISPEDRSVNFLFGDAGSATALEFERNVSGISVVAGTDGTGEKNLITPARGFRNIRTGDANIRKQATDGNIRSEEDLYMNGSEIFNFTLDRVPQLVANILETHGWETDDVDYLVLHQANKFILDYLANKMDIEKKKILSNIEEYGNTSSASIPLLITTLLRDRVLSNKPVNLCLVGFGVGYSWAASALTVQGLKCVEVIN